MRIIGFDIGGANIKAADNDGHTVSRPFEVWRKPNELRSVLAEILAGFPVRDRLAVTMTAELADCFETKAEGVDFILSAVEDVSANSPIDVWQTSAEFVSPEVAREIPLLVAAANWHALATFVGRMVPTGNSLLIDIGTTTTDIIPLENGIPIPVGLTDSERLASGELLYTGVKRTPICAIVQAVPFRERQVPVAAELFATSLDVYLLLGRIEEDATDWNTANGRPATMIAAHDRIARMLCCDRSELSRSAAIGIAEYVACRQRAQIVDSIKQVVAHQNSRPEHILLSGSGSFLGQEIVHAHHDLSKSNQISLNEIFGPNISEAACAFALARLAAEA